MTAKRKRPRLTKKAARGLGDLVAILDGVMTAGWEGTSLDNHYCSDHEDSQKTCERCRERGEAEAAFGWLVGVYRSLPSETQP